ncbi:uncharacterized protein LOC126264230 isoform X2 [Aethina tumida]|uniref:uncharacterized protein LOC126264230 isoform X2 n=1 Tax=Aethina tumida TaxID=116153 RepID=UPI002148D19A|nr:uncharacterized protein LOC126264230 isoform X2 [Aethina tumida]
MLSKLVLIFSLVIMLQVLSNSSNVLAMLCPENEVWNDCGNRCNERYCNESMEKKPRTKECNPEGGCHCKRGFKRDPQGPTCRQDEMWVPCGDPCPYNTCNIAIPCPKICNVNGGCVCRPGSKPDKERKCIPCNA